MMNQWIGAIILLATVTFVVFAFRQGQKVKPDRGKDPDEWTRQTGGGGDHSGI